MLFALECQQIECVCESPVRTIYPLMTVAYVAKVERITAQKWDVVIADDDEAPIGVLISKLSGSVLVRYRQGALSEGSAYSMSLPYPPAFIPAVGSATPFPMGILGRLENLAMVGLGVWGRELRHHRALDDVVTRLFPAQKPESLVDIRRRAEFVLVDSPLGLEFPRPAQPNVISLSGLACPEKEQSASLQQAVLKRIQAAKGGVVVVSFGTSFADAPEEVAQNLLEAFQKFKEHLFLWRYDGPQLSNASGNVVFLDADVAPRALLSVSRVKAFVSDGSREAWLSAVCAQVPLLGLPFGGSEAGNLVRLARRKSAVALPRSALYSEGAIRGGLEEILSHPSYRHSIGSLKQTLEDEIQSPLDSAVFWVEFAVRHQGASALKHNPDMDVNLISYLGLDAWYLALAVIILTMTVAKKLVSFLLFPSSKQNAKLKSS